MTLTAVTSATSAATFRPSITDRDVCLQCRRQQCASVCPTLCYTRRDEGRVDLDVSRCIECRACVHVCYEFTNIEWRGVALTAGS